MKLYRLSDATFYDCINMFISLSWIKLIVLGFNDTSTLEGHFVSSPREREKRDKKRE